MQTKGFGASVFYNIGILVTNVDGMVFTDHNVIGAVGVDRAGIDAVYGESNPVQRCRNHKIRNVEGVSFRDKTTSCKLNA